MSVAVRKGKDVRKNLEEIFSELNFVPGKRVYVKPNLCGRTPILPGENTSMEVLDALIDALKARGCEIIIGHGALLGTRERQINFAQTLRESGFEKYAAMPGVRVVNLDDLERTALEVDGFTFHLPLRFLLEEIDTYVNLAKIKSHMETGVSFSLKNQMGLPAAGDRQLMHKTGLELNIARLGLACRPDMSILEGYPAMEGNGPHHGSAKNLRLLAAGTDMVELDSLAASLLGFDARTIAHIAHAADMGAGSLASTETLNRFPGFSVPGFRKAGSVFRFGRNFFAYPTFSCSLCISAVDQVGKEVRRHPFRYWRFIAKAFLSRKRHAVVFGRADSLSIERETELLCVGSCARRFAALHGASCLDMCPPGFEETRSFLTK